MKKINFLGLGIIALALTILTVASSAKADTLYRQLELGSSGSDVGSLQSFLAQDITIYPQGLVTSYFGSLTKSAVSNFQARNGIATVGRVGPITLVALNAQMNGGNNSMGDTHAPVISNLNLSMTSSDASFNWNTSENASAIIYYSTSPIYMTEASAGTSITIYGSSFLVHSDLRSSHSGTLSGLQANTTYYYVVYARDGSGNETVTWPTTFHTNN